MAKEIVVLWVGRHDREPWRSLCSDYERRIARLLPIQVHQIRVKPVPDRQLEVEGAALTRSLPKGAYTFALDRRGKALSSTGLSQLVVRHRDTWSGPLTFVVGSDLGLAGSFVDSCQFRLSLGRLTLPHELARLVLMEQLYRALAIDKGIKYHREPI